MTREQIIDLIKLRCEDLDPILICAIVEQESNFDPWAIRFEPGFLDRYVRPIGLSNITEVYARSFSYGLMQIMGQVARELDYKGPIAQLLEPETNLFYGMRHLRNKLARAGGDVKKTLLAWNGGGNSFYPDQVLARLKHFAQPDPRDERMG